MAGARPHKSLIWLNRAWFWALLQVHVLVQYRNCVRLQVVRLFAQTRKYSTNEQDINQKFPIEDEINSLF